MRRTAYMGLFLTLFATLAAPGFAQQINDPAEYAAYMKVYEEKDPAKKAPLGEKFIVDYPKTTAITHTYMQVLLSYARIPNWAKALETADKQPQMAPTLGADDKKTVMVVGMTAAEQVKNVARLKFYVEKVLENDPKNAGALVTLSGLLANSIPASDADKPKHFDETLTITKRALAAPKPAEFTDPVWATVRVQLHDTACMVLLNQKKYPETIAECAEALKLNKKDGYAYYLTGMAMKPAVAAAIAEYTAAVNKLNENRTAGQLERDEMKADADGKQAAATAKTNELVEVFAKSVATGWQGAQNPSHNELKIFTGTPEELEQLIQKMKTLI